MPRLKFTRLAVDELVAYEARGVRGDYLDVSIPQDTLVVDMLSLTVLTEGEITYTRTEGFGLHPEVVARAGTVSGESELYDTILAGRLRAEVTSDTFAMYCLATVDRRPIRGQSLRLEAAQTSHVDPGLLLFVASGSITVNGTAIALQAPALLDVEKSVAGIYSDGGAMCVLVPKG